MYVRIHIGSGTFMDFELDIEFSQLTPQIKRAVKEAIFSETGIQPEKQDVVFCRERNGRQNSKKLSLPPDIKLPHPVSPDTKYPLIFKQSTVYVTKADEWNRWDARRPDNRTKVVSGKIEFAGKFLQDLYGELERSRIVDVSLLDKYPHFRDGIKGEWKLRNFLVAGSTSSSSHAPEVSPAEMSCYDNIFRDNAKGAQRFKFRNRDSMRMHTLYFSYMLLQPPFFFDKHSSLRKLEMAVESPLGFRIFIKPDDEAEIYKVAPQNAVVITDKLSGLPTLMYEVDLGTEQSDRERMILQGSVACRQWRYILPRSLEEKNMLLGLFVRDDLAAELFLFHADSEYKVEVFWKSFLLYKRNPNLLLSRILFNYRDKLLDIIGKADHRKLKLLKRIVSSCEIPPISPSRNDRQPGKNRTYPFLLSAQVESLLCPDGASIQGTEREHVAVVRMSEPPFKPLGFIKVANKSELDAFEVIRKSGIQLLLNRVILPTNIVEVSGYTLMFFPYCGEALEYSWGNEDGPLGHEVEVVWDLLIIFSHLHKLRIAHLDVKPTNILWDSVTHSIRVIDFDSSEIVDPNGSQKIKGLLGTSGYVAPEVESDDVEYDPFLADAYSCGLVIRQLVISEKMSEEKWFVHGIAESLSEDRVNERWGINKAIESWVGWLKEHGRPVYENRLFG